LREPKQYDEIYRQGTRIRGTGFSLIFRANNLQEDRLGISISGVRLAVKRNRIKRIIKEFYRTNRSFPSQVAQQKGFLGNTDMVIATRKHFLPDSLAELSRALTSCLLGNQGKLRDREKSGKKTTQLNCM
jgi:ribonuclease P protein component